MLEDPKQSHVYMYRTKDYSFIEWNVISFNPTFLE